METRYRETLELGRKEGRKTAGGQVGGDGFSPGPPRFFERGTIIWESNLYGG